MENSNPLQSLHKMDTKCKRADDYYVYICKAERSGHYTGIAKNVAKRLSQHGGPQGAKYLRGKGEVVLLWQSRRRYTLSEALRREAAIKSGKLPVKRQTIAHYLMPLRSTPALRSAGYSVTCPSCQSNNLNPCQPTPQAGRCPSWRCLFCGVKFIVTNPSSLTKRRQRP